MIKTINCLAYEFGVIPANGRTKEEILENLEEVLDELQFHIQIAFTTRDFDGFKKSRIKSMFTDFEDGEYIVLTRDTKYGFEAKIDCEDLSKLNIRTIEGPEMWTGTMFTALGYNRKLYNIIPEGTLNTNEAPDENQFEYAYEDFSESTRWRTYVNFYTKKNKKWDVGPLITEL